MARTKTKPEPVVEDNGERDWSNLKDKDTTWMHDAFAEFIEDEAGIKVPPKHIQAVTAMRVAFRQSDTYLDAKEENAKAQAETEPEPEAPKAKRSRAAKTEQSAAKPATRTRRSRAKSPEPEVTVGKDDPKPARSRRARRTKPATDESSTTPEAPF